MKVGVILAGGRGERMGAGRNKALLPLAGRPLLLYSLETFDRCVDRLIVVSHQNDLEAVRTLTAGRQVVIGGATRQGSEWAALLALRESLAPDDVVAIHDAARPLILVEDVQAVLAAAERTGAAMLAEPASLPLLRVLEPPSASAGGGTVEMAYAAGFVWRAQTPQAARAGLLLAAYERAAADGFDGTDTAAVLSRYGCEVSVVAASGENPKVTVPADLPLAEQVLAARAAH